MALSVGLISHRDPNKAGKAMSTFLIVYFTSYFMFNIAVLPHSPGVVH